MSNVSATSTSPDVPLDRSGVTRNTEDIAELMRTIFDKHKMVCKSHRQLEIENKKLKEETSKDANDPKIIRNLLAELADAKAELKSTKTMVAKLSADNQALQKEVKHWFRLSLKRETPIIPMLSATGEPVENTITPRTHNASEPSGSIKKNPTSLEKTNKITQLTLNSEDEFEEIQNDIPKADPKEDIDFKKDDQPCSSTTTSTAIGSLTTMNADVDAISIRKPPKKRLRTKTPSPKPSKIPRPLQTNTCKVCEAYWRAEDARESGQLKSHDLPHCRIHGRKRPPCTPENFWKVRLSPPP